MEEMVKPEQLPVPRLRINGAVCELHSDLRGENCQYSALKRGEEFLNVTLEGAKIQLSHPIIQQLLRDIEKSEPDSPVDALMKQAVDKLEAAFRSR